MAVEINKVRECTIDEVIYDINARHSCCSLPCRMCTPTSYRVTFLKLGWFKAQCEASCLRELVLHINAYNFTSSAASNLNACFDVLVEFTRISKMDHNGSVS